MFKKLLIFMKYCNKHKQQKCLVKVKFLLDFIFIENV